MTKKEIRKFIAAIKKNGYRQTTSFLFRNNPYMPDPFTACAMGQGAINFGIVTEQEARNDPTFATTRVMNWINDNDLNNFYTRVYVLNDEVPGMTCEAIAKQLEADLAEGIEYWVRHMFKKTSRVAR